MEYEDGTVDKVELGRRFGKASGAVYPHNVVTNLKEGDSVSPGTAIAYNEGFFTPDSLNPGEVIWKAGVMCKTALLESSDTFEDSSAISEKIAKKLATDVTHVRHIFLDFEREIRNLVEVGDTVDAETPLCLIEDSVTADNDLFDEDTLDTLRMLSSNAPRAKWPGKVERIEVLYYGDKEDMSESLKHVTEQSDRDRARRARALGEKATTGAVDDSIRIDAKVLDIDSLVIKVYITEEEGAGTGDKGVFGNQMKTIFARVMSGTNETESGEEVDALFAMTSISNRIINSPMVMGTTNTLLRVLSKHAAKVYKEG